MKARKGVTVSTDHHDVTASDLLAELRELTQDVSGDDDVRARRLAVLRRLESRIADGDRPQGLAVA